jgi:8-oxo-dGTP diphosphatase
VSESPKGTRTQRAVARCLLWPWGGVLLRFGIRLFAPRHRIGALVVVVDDRRRFLMVEHLFRPDQPWGLPGGWVNRRESPQATAKRELMEETSLEVEIGPVVALRSEPRPWHVTIVFAGRLRGGELKLSFELKDCAWVDIDGDLPDLPPFEQQAIAAACHWNSG